MMSGTKRDASAGLDPEGGDGGDHAPFDFDNRSVTQTKGFFNTPVNPVVLGCTCILVGETAKC